MEQGDDADCVVGVAVVAVVAVVVAAVAADVDIGCFVVVVMGVGVVGNVVTAGVVVSTKVGEGQS